MNKFYDSKCHDLLEDESFRQWALGQASEETTLWWEEAVLQSPQQAPVLERAKNTLLALADDTFTLPQERIQRNIQRIMDDLR